MKSVLTLLLGLSLGGTLAAQELEIIQLETDNPVTGEIKTDDSQVYHIDLETDQFVYGVADQHSVDVVVTVTSPSGQPVGTFDSPSRGEEPFIFTTTDSGAYRIEIKRFRDEKGSYTLTLKRVERTALTPEGRIDQLLLPYDHRDSPGAAVAVMLDGKVVHAKGYGMANLEYDVPITTSTVFDIASLAKQFTGMAIAMLSNQGKLSLDDDIRKYIPEVPDFGKTITIRHLVHHTSGIRDWPGTLAIGGWRMDDIISFEQILNMVERQRELNFEPGTEYLYCNTGYNLLAETVSRITGQSFRAWTDANMFKPLGMADTHFHDDPQMVVRNRAHAYLSDGETFKSPSNGLVAPGSSSLYTTIDDLTKWTQNFEDARVGGKEVLAQMHERGFLNNGEQINYAFGNGIGTHKGLRRVDHSGGWAGFSSYLTRFPDQRFAVIVLSNAASFDVGMKSTKITDLYLGEHLAAPEPENKERDRQDHTGTAVEPWHPDREDLLVYAGEYYAPELENFYSVTVKAERLLARHLRHGDIELTPVEKDVFKGGDWFFSRVVFERDSDTITGMRVSNGRVRNVLMQRQD